MTRPVLIAALAHGQTHAAHAGHRVTLCGVVAVELLALVRSAFDVTCDACGEQVIQVLGLTPPTDPGNVRLNEVEGEA